MAVGLQKSLAAYFRRALRLAKAAVEERLNYRATHHFDIPGSQWFDPSFFPGFFD